MSSTVTRAGTTRVIACDSALFKYAAPPLQHPPQSLVAKPATKHLGQNNIQDTLGLLNTKANSATLAGAIALLESDDNHAVQDARQLLQVPQSAGGTDRP